MFGEELNSEYISAVAWSSVLLPILSEGHYLKIPLSGTSMYPLLLGGRDDAIISSISGKKLKRGDIVMYVREDKTHVLHRIHHVKGTDCFMLGDSQTWIEGPIKEAAVLAIADQIIRKGRVISCNRLFYRFAVELWLLARPLRPSLLIFIKKSLIIFKRLKKG